MDGTSMKMMLSRSCSALLLALLVSATGCTRAEWEREEYRLPEGRSWENVDGYRISASLVPQTRYGESGMSLKGPYKVRVQSAVQAGYARRYARLRALKITVNLLETGRQFEAIDSGMEAEFRSVGSGYVVTLPSDVPFQPDFPGGERVEVSLELELLNPQSSEGRKFALSYLFLPIHSSGVSDIPLITH